jgi:hypothetical protein
VLSSYKFSADCADGDPIVEIKCTRCGRSEKFNKRHAKPLDFSDYSTNNADIDIVLMYLLIRSEQAEEGARSFLLLWLV